MNEIDAFYALLRSDFKSFVIKVFKEISGNGYLDNWHIDVICSEIGLVLDGKQNRLIINIPPRYMKSIICSVALPAFILGHNPRESIICVSYSDGFAEKMALDCRRVMESGWYRIIFPGTILSNKRHRVSDFETTRGGGRFSTSVDGALTGRGGNWIIVDDPIKTSDANSDSIRTKTNEWYGNTLISRLNDKNNGKILVIMQRTHEADFTGHLLEIDPTYKLIKIPGIAVEDETWKIRDMVTGKEWVKKRKTGEALHPERENLLMLQEKQNTMGSYDFSSQYQQNPTSRGGNIIKREWFKFYDLKDLESDIMARRLHSCRLGQSWDTASKAAEHNDYSVCITYLAAGDHKYILDVYRERLEFPDLVKKAIELKTAAEKKYKNLFRSSATVIIEELNSGVGLYQTLARKYGNSTIKPYKPEHDKATRLKMVSHLIENGTCLFPKDNPPWWESFEQEIIKFPNGKYDDQCDAFSQLLAYEDAASKDLSWLKKIG